MTDWAERLRTTDWKETIGRRLHALHLDSIRSQILVFAVVATLVPTVALTIASSRQTRRAETERAEAELRRASAETAWDVSLWLTDRQRDLRVAASSYAVSDNLNGGSQASTRLRDYLTSVRERCTECEGLLVSDGHGRPVSSSGGRMSGVALSAERLNALRTGDVVMGEPYWDSGIGKAAITLAVPIRKEDGKLQGALTAKINLRSLTDALQRLAPAEGGDVTLMTDQGRLILRGRVSSAELLRTKLPQPLMQTLFDQEGSIVSYKRADGQDVLGILRRLPQLRWATAVELPEAAVGSGVGAVTPVVLGTLVVGVGLVAYLLGLLIVRPLARLTSAAAKVAAGDLAVELPSGGGGEVGYLTQVFKNLVTRVREREGQGELERLSVTDALTGLYNRRHLTGTLANEVQRSRRLRRTFAVLLIDVDRFKQYNDTHGHLAGDAALVKIAEILRKTTRAVDSVARYGGEEFLVLLLETTLATAASVAERIRTRVASETFEGGKVTVSIGAAEYPAHGDTPEELIASADAAMYKAKEAGRDRVAVAGAPEGKKRRRKGDE
ncbi:MAG TPA: diguanylate cyclase [Gemmatimonadales bacterium]|nr:diguanylate cyclase [Gemmatimonadales bacterium]